MKISNFLYSPVCNSAFSSYSPQILSSSSVDYNVVKLKLVLPLSATQYQDDDREREKTYPKSQYVQIAAIVLCFDFLFTYLLNHSIIIDNLISHHTFSQLNISTILFFLITD